MGPSWVALAQLSTFFYTPITTMPLSRHTFIQCQVARVTPEIECNPVTAVKLSNGVINFLPFGPL